MNTPTNPAPFQPRTPNTAGPSRHVYGNRVICNTDTRGYPTPQNRSPLKLVVDATEGFIPLWAENTHLRWRFQEQSMGYFADPDAAASEIERLLGEALLAWGEAAPVRFVKRSDAWDFEIAMVPNDECDNTGCVLASAFFPDSGRHELLLYPMLFQQSPEEQVATLAHETGHIFGLRHFFAAITEKQWKSQLFGTHRPFTIMNYGTKSVLTEDDQTDLSRLYELARSGELEKINGTPIRLVNAFHTL